MAEGEELAKTVGVGELSRDYGLDITVSDGGLVTSALNQRQYRAECGKLYQQFMLSMADYIFEEAQLKKKLQSLLLQKKQPRLGSAAPVAEGVPDLTELIGDEDAFTPAQMDEFRRLANSRAGSVSRAGVVSKQDIVRPPNSAPNRASSRMGGVRSETPHIFPALKERPLTSMSKGRKGDSRSGSATTTGNKRHSLTSGANLYGGRDQEYDGVMDPTADFSANRRMRMNPRAFSRLFSAGRIKVKVMDKTGDFVLKPVTGKPGVVSVNGTQDKDEDAKPLMDSKDKMALVKTTTSFKSPTLSSELKTNNLVAIQRSLLGQETKRMTVGEVMAKSRDRRARLFRVQMSTGRLDDWDVPGEERGRPPTRAASAGGRSLAPSRLGSFGPSRGVMDAHHGRTDSPLGMTITNTTSSSQEESLRSRAKTAPAHRPHGRSTSTPIIPEADESSEAGSGRGRGGGGLGVPARPASRSVSPAMRKVGGGERGGGVRSHSPAPPPRLNVVQLELKDSAGGSGFRQTPYPSPQQHPHPHPPSSAGRAGQAVPRATPRSGGSQLSTSRAIYPVSSKSLADAGAQGKKRPYTVRFGGGKEGRSRTEAAQKEAAENCSVQINHIHTMRDSAAVVRRWKELDKDREEKLNKWRMRMSFAATRRGNLGKMLARA